MSLAYDVSASISCTASPGIRRGSVNTIIDAMSSDGSAIRSRRARYLLSTVSAVQPGCHEPPAVIVADVGGVVLDRGVPDADVNTRRQLHVVLLLRQVALQVVDDLAALGGVERPALPHQQVGGDGVV